MKYRIITPEGKVIEISEREACFKTPEKRCVLINKNIAEALVNYAWHKGWKVEKVE